MVFAVVVNCFHRLPPFPRAGQMSLGSGPKANCPNQRRCNPAHGPSRTFPLSPGPYSIGTSRIPTPWNFPPAVDRTGGAASPDGFRNRTCYIPSVAPWWCAVSRPGPARSPRRFPVLDLQIQRQLQQVLSVEDGKGGRSGRGLAIIVAAVHHQRFLPTTSLRGHQPQVREAVVLPGVVAAGLLFQVIAALVADLERRDLVVDALVCVLVSREPLQPFLGHLHAGSGPISAIFPGFTGDDGMADGGVFLGGPLKQINLPGGLL